MSKVGIITIVAGALMCAAAGTADAGLIVETEPNNTMGTANHIGIFGRPGGSVLVDGSITPNDVDWFEFVVTGDTQLVSATFGIPTSAVGDSILSLYDSLGNLITQDDDGGIGAFSAIEAIIPAGTYFLVVTGFPDFGNTGSHNQDFVYKLTLGVNVVPAPGALALLGLAGLVSRRRRRN